MRFFNTLSLEKAFESMEERNKINLKTEIVTLEDSMGRTLSEDIISSISLPSFNRSTVDGYAVDVRDVFGASETFPSPLTLLGEVEMGKTASVKIQRGACVYVPTGGMVPEGADGVVMIEDCEELLDEILIGKGISAFSNMILTGDEVKEGEVLVKAGEIISAAHIGVLASVGLEKVPVLEKMKFAVISTGDEIVSLGSSLKNGEVYDINTHIISALVREAGGEVVSTTLVRDNMELLRESLNSSLQRAHVVLISGGSSVGVRDFTEKAIEDMGGELFIHGIAVKPGKPTIGASWKDKLIFGLPGHPQSAANVFRCLVEPALTKKVKKSVFARLGENLYGDPGKVCFVNVKLVEEHGELTAYPIFGKSSMIRPLMESCGYVAIPDFKEGLYAGEIVKVVLNG